MTMTARRWLGAGMLATLAMVATAAVVVLRSTRGADEPRRAARAEFVGAEKCGSCHGAEYSAWKTSQHSVSMQDVQPGIVLGRFDGTRLSNGGVTSTFFRRGNRYFANTQGPDGRLRDFEIRYVFGVWPLQQYLVEFPGGRLQALSIAWDARPAAQGGQRWFSLHPGEIVAPTAWEHWTGRGYNWNYMCADCHSTGVRKGYDAATDAFHTTRAEINVACEACHGPGSEHVRWGSYPSLIRRVAWRSDGLPAPLMERRAARWSVAPGARTASRSAPRTTDREIETCAQCHARRVHIAEGYAAGKPLLDYYIPAPITSNIYYPDGQQKEEVYTYGSFLQSKMYGAGVTCADCHDPHTQKLRRAGNRVCTQCHLAAAYDTAAHHFHPTGSAGASCASCHMPATTFMQIDPRHDHSIRIPRPDLSVTLGVPNACSHCHVNRDAPWAADRVRAWYGKPVPGFQRFAAAFAADDRGDAGAADSLGAVANDATQPAIVRASALARLTAHPGGVALRAAEAWSRDPDPFVRLAALQILEAAPTRERVAIGTLLLADRRRAVRQGAAWVLAPYTRALGSPEQRSFARAAAEFVASQRYNADQLEDRFVLAAFYAQLGRTDSAIAELQSAAVHHPDDARIQEALRSLRAPRR